MSAEKKDNWSSEAYQNAASFVPKLATKIVEWLDPQKDDAILDIGCGDGVLSLDIARVLSSGDGYVVGIDSSPAMIAAAQTAAKDAGLQDQTDFAVMDATKPGTAFTSDLPNGHSRFDKVFSNAAMHWILRPKVTRKVFFERVKDCMEPGGRFAFEMGGLGNCSEMRAALLMAVGRRIGLAKAQEVDPWFFPDEAWITDMMEEKVGGWKIEKMERERRPTTADEGGVDGWIRLMGKQFFEAIPEEQREECIREVVDVLEVVCAKPGVGFMFSYVRLRVLARKL